MLNVILFTVLFTAILFAFIIILDFVEKMRDFLSATLNVKDWVGEKKLVYVDKVFVETTRWFVNGEEVTHGNDWSCTIYRTNVPTVVEAEIVPKLWGLQEILPFLPRRRISVDL